MHPKNPYKDRPPDFRELSKQSPELAKYLIPTGSSGSTSASTLDFRSDSALRALASALLARDFGLDVRIPDDRLAPTIPNRLDYVLHLLDLLPYLEPNAAETGHGDSKRNAWRFLDIGTGASAIYALLLAKLCSSASQVIGTELDEPSFLAAQDNMLRNAAPLGERCQILRATQGSKILFPIAEAPVSSIPFTFTLCNPPFYASQTELESLRDQKASAAHAAPTAGANELVTPGGEVAFVGQMIDESMEDEMRGKCLWYTSLLGKSSSIAPLVEKLKGHKIDNYFLLSLRQARTVRWVIGWSLQPIRLPDHLVRHRTATTWRYLPKSNTFSFAPPTLPPDRSDHLDALPTLRHAVSAAIEEAGLADALAHDSLSFFQTGASDRLELSPTAVTWSRAARRARVRGEMTPTTELSGECEPIFRATLAIRRGVIGPDENRTADDDPDVDMDAPEASTDVDAGRVASVTLDWTWGRERTMVEGFWAFMTRKVSDQLRQR